VAGGRFEKRWVQGPPWACARSGPTVDSCSQQRTAPLTRGALRPGAPPRPVRPPFLLIIIPGMRLNSHPVKRASSAEPLRHRRRASVHGPAPPPLEETLAAASITRPADDVYGAVPADLPLASSRPPSTASSKPSSPRRRRRVSRPSPRRSDAAPTAITTPSASAADVSPTSTTPPWTPSRSAPPVHRESTSSTGPSNSTGVCRACATHSSESNPARPASGPSPTCQEGLHGRQSRQRRRRVSRFDAYAAAR